MRTQEQLAIQSCQSGDQSQFALLYDTYIDQIYRFVFFKVNSTSIAEDITSDVFFRALQKIHTFKLKEGANFRAWIYRIAHNLVIDHYRKHQELYDIGDFLNIGVSDNFQQNIDNKNKIEEVKQFISSLNSRERDVILYRIWHDLSYQEISQIMDISIENCKQITSRTLRKIQGNITPLLLCFLIF